MQDIILFRAIKDFFSKKILFLSFAPFLIPVILLSFIFYAGGNEIANMLIQGSQNGDFSFLDENTHPIFAFLLGLSVVHWLIITLMGVFGTLGVILLSLLIAMVVVGFLTPVIIQTVRKRHYPSVKAVKPDSTLKSLGIIGMIILKFLGIFLFCLPFLLLPFVSFFILNIPFFYLFYKFMLYDLLSCGISYDASRVLHENSLYLFSVLVLFFFISLIPFIGLFFQLFFVTYLSHFILSKSI
jgi:hypothetical protein